MRAIGNRIATLLITLVFFVESAVTPVLAADTQDTTTTIETGAGSDPATSGSDTSTQTQSSPLESQTEPSTTETPTSEPAATEPTDSGLTNGQAVIVDYPKVDYKVTDKIDLTGIKIVAKTADGQDITYTDQDVINLTGLQETDLPVKYYDKLFDPGFIKNESDDFKNELSKYLTENNITQAESKITLNIEGLDPISFDINVSNDGLGLSPLEMLNSLKLKPGSMMALSVDRLSFFKDEEIKVNSLQVLAKDANGDVKIFAQDELTLAYDNIKKEEFPQGESDPSQTFFLEVKKEGYESLKLPITVSPLKENISDVSDFPELTLNKYGLKLDEQNSIYTLGLDLKDLGTIKKIDIEFLDKDKANNDSITIDRIVKTNGYEETDLSLTRGKYRGIDDKDLAQAADYKIINPISLSEDLQTGFSYNFFIKATASSLDTAYAKIKIERQGDTAQAANIIDEKIVEIKAPTVSDPTSPQEEVLNSITEVTGTQPESSDPNLSSQDNPDQAQAGSDSFASPDGQSMQAEIQITKMPRTTYKSGEKLDLSELEITIKESDGNTRVLKYDDLISDPNIKMNLHSGDYLLYNYYNPLFDSEFLKDESQETLDVIKQYINENNIQEYKPTLAIEIPGYQALSINIDIEDSNLNLSSLELFQALKMENSSMSLLSADKLTYKPSEDISIDNFRFLIKDDKGLLSVITGSQLSDSAIKVDYSQVDQARQAFIDPTSNQSLTKDQKEPTNTYITLTKEAYKDLYLPITLVTEDSLISSSDQFNNLDVSSWGMVLGEDSAIYTLTLDIKSLSDIKEINLDLLNQLTSTRDNITIDRIVETNGYDEKDLGLSDSSYIDSLNNQVKNPTILAKDLKVGYKYVFLIRKEADSDQSILLDLSAKGKSGSLITDKIILGASEPAIGQRLNIFASSSTNTYNTKTDPTQTTTRTNYGVYKIDVGDFHFGYDLYSGANAMISAPLDIYIRVPKDVQAGQTFTVDLPPDFTVNHALNSTDPLGVVYKKGDHTTPLITVYYKSNQTEPDLLNMSHYLEFTVTEEGAKLINDTEVDYEGKYSIGQNVTYSLIDGVGYKDNSSNPDWSKDTTYFSAGVYPILNRWTSSTTTDTSITKTFTFDSVYGFTTTSLKDQSTLAYVGKANETLGGGDTLFTSYTLGAYTKYNNPFYYIAYYVDGVRYAKFGRVINGGNTTSFTTKFTYNLTTPITSRAFVATGGGDAKVGSFKGSLTEYTLSKTGVITFSKTENRINSVTTAKTAYIENTVQIPDGFSGNVITVTTTLNNQTSTRQDYDAHFYGEIDPSLPNVFVKIVKEDKDGDGIEEEYAVTNDTAL
ncbi:MAG: hypothetical protein SPI59_00065 [Finegoldia sp.]|nr:hypothetical protein [Finegoldia sp.]